MNANLLKNRTLLAIMKSRWYPAVFQALAAVGFTVIVYQLVAGPVAAHQNLGTARTWVLWWPLIPILFLLLGRFWCAICPFGTLSDLVQKFVGNERPVPVFLKKYGIWIIDALFILITWSDHVWGIVENPWGSGVLLLLLTTGVVASGAFFQRRTWCRYLCFLGGLSGNYALAGMVALRATPEVCATCKSKAACYNGSEKGPGCPMFEFPRQMDSNANCNLCAACIKTCPNGSIQLTVQPPTKELWSIKKPKFEQAFLAVVIMGIVFIQNITMLEGWPPVLQSLERTIAALDAELDAVEKAIKDLLNRHPDLKREAKRLDSVSGIGEKTVLPILVLLHRWKVRTSGRGTAKGLTAFAGLDPQRHDSGSSVHKRARISKMGDHSIRHYLYMGALGGIRGNNPLRTFYRRLVSRGKAKRLALVAAAHKILTWAWAVFTQDVDFDPSRFSSEATAAA
jgi:polyferredoxin